jgi:hypothetical protein
LLAGSVQQQEESNGESNDPGKGRPNMGARFERQDAAQWQDADVALQQAPDSSKDRKAVDEQSVTVAAQLRANTRRPSEFDDFLVVLSVHDNKQDVLEASHQLYQVCFLRLLCKFT